MSLPKRSSLTKATLVPKAKEEEQQLHKANANHETEASEADSPPQEVSAAALISGMTNPRGASRQTILAMQSTFGNRAVQRAILQSKASGQVQRRGRSDAVMKGSSFYESDGFVSFADAMSNPKLYKYFYAFGETQYITANFELMEAIKKYKASPTLKLARSIYSTYISKSLKQANLPGNVVTEIQNALQKIRFWQSPPASLFDKAEKVLIEDLTGTYSMFLISPYFKAWQRDAPIPEK